MNAPALRHPVAPLLALIAVCGVTHLASAGVAPRPAPNPAIPLAFQPGAPASGWNAIRWPMAPDSRSAAPGASAILARSPALRAQLERVTRGGSAEISLSHAGRTIVQTQDTDANFDGTSDLRYITTSTYDQRGNLTRYVFETDRAFDHVIDQRYVEIFGYDQHDDVVRHVIESDNEADGHIDFRYDARMTYNSRGLMIGSDLRGDNNGDGTVDYRITLETLTFDGRGNPLELVEDIDNGVDGTVDTRTLRSLGYDARGNVVREEAVTDNGMNGPDYRFIATAAYDTRGNVVQLGLEEDNDVDGVINSRVTEAIDYDTHDLPVLDVEEFDNNADGVLEGRTTTTNGYNHAGTLMASVEEGDLGGDGSIDSRSVLATLESDRQERPLRQTIEHDFNNDGLIEIRYSIALAYGPHGNLVREVIDNDFGADGRTDSRVTVTFEYGGNPRPAQASIGDGLAERFAMTRPSLASVTPNPSRALATLRYALPAPGRIELSVYDAGGRRVRTLTDQVTEAGEHQVTWDGRDASGRLVAPGVYFARLEAAGFKTSRTLLRVR